MNVEHRHNHKYRNDPREVVRIPTGVLPVDVEEALNKIQQSYLVSAHKSLDPAAGAVFLAARRPRVACGCL